MAAEDIRTLHLEKQADYSATVFLVKKDWTIHFFLDSALNFEQVKFYCNQPRTRHDEFDSEKFYCMDWKKKNDSVLFPDCYAEVQVNRAGVFKFHLKGNKDENMFCQGCFIVEPSLYKQSGEVLNIESIAMQTVLSKNLGPFVEWESRLRVAHECNFNTVHFSPLQELGESNSCYSIRDHLNFNPNFSTDECQVTENVMDEFVQEWHKKWDMFFIVDVVWNHVSNCCEWIKDHTEASYNLVNTPHLRPAFLVDRVLWYFNEEISNGVWKDKGVPNFIANEDHLNNISTILRQKLVAIRLEEFYKLDVESVVNEFREEISIHSDRDKLMKEVEDYRESSLEIIQHPGYRRNGCYIDMNVALCKFYGLGSREECCNNLRIELENLNSSKQGFVDEVINKIIGNAIGHIRYHFIDNNGPKYGTVTKEHSISVRYFCYPFDDSNYDHDSQLIDTPESALLMAHNGWVMGGDAIKGFIHEESLVFLCRELVAWGDSIKLRYGDGPSDSPFLWDYMREYTEQMARIFHGFRLDNCHSTPLHVAEYLLNCARKVRPDLYVIAELFTNDEYTDNLFVNRLGLNSMIRENMGAFSPYDLGRHIHRFGGHPVGSFIAPTARPLMPSVAPALFMDITHDNESLYTKRSVFDFLPSCGLVAASGCAIGSTRGFDEIVPHHINVVTESRLYQKWSEKVEDGGIDIDMGLLKARRALNQIHEDLQKNGFTEIYVDQMTDDIVAVTRHAPATHESIIFVAHCSFSNPPDHRYPKVNAKFHESFPPLHIEGALEEILFEGQLLEKNSTVFQKHPDFINGVSNYILMMQEHVSPTQSKLCKVNFNEKGTELYFKNFLPGSVLVLKVSGKPEINNCIHKLRKTLDEFVDYDLSLPNKPEIHRIIEQMNLVDLNKVLYRCDAEERDDGFGGGVYNVPGSGDMVYCGLQGTMSLLSEIAPKNDLGHPLCNNLREGNWLLGYTANRLKNYHTTNRLAAWLENVFDDISSLPRFLVPCYFEAVIRRVYEKCLACAFKAMSQDISNGSSFAKDLSLGTVQLCGEIKSARLPAITPSPEHQTPGIDYDCVTMAAGLPHFATGFMRCWGRDTFISLRGLMLITERFDVARQLLLAYASVIRHGLVPNLLASGVNARYNARDATWFWLQAVQQYTQMSPEGTDLLKCKVFRMYPTDDNDPFLYEEFKDSGNTENMCCPLYDLIHEILQRHFQGISFRERNAGERLDRDMSDEGFNVTAGVRIDTGFVYGGSKENCGTWMDKMGSSRLAQNAGHPATPRDGSAVEIVGLLKSTLRWLVQLHNDGKYPHNVVEKINKKGEKICLAYSEWNDLVQNNFEEKFYISANPPATEKLVNKRLIYKDSYLSTNQFTDYQLRPNFPIAMCVAPELFDPEHAWNALTTLEDHLLGPMGLATLDPTDWAYDGFYENHLDTTEFKKAKGFNYHQGPEWTWVLGPFLRAKLIMAKRLDGGELFIKTVNKTREILARHKKEIMLSPWRGLTELTNKDGAYCSHSCPTQAWSSACLLEVLYDMEKMKM